MHFFVLVLTSLVVTSTATTVHLQARGETPELPYDPNTTPYCFWWFDNLGLTCEETWEAWGIERVDFLRWNPSITPDCGNYFEGKSYCVDVSGEPAPGIPTTTSRTSSATLPTSTPIPSSTTPSNGISTPLPTQPGMVDNCDAFYRVALGEGCEAIAFKSGITPTEFYTWNPLVGTNCAGLWADVNVCVSITGHTPTPTNPGNGISTPSPIQPGMVFNCDSFYLTKAGDQCGNIATKNGILLSEFTTWNPQVGATCGGLWADVYVCISIVGHTPAPTTPTNPGNGITTPTPIQPGMVTNCDSFYLTKSGDQCGAISSANGISLSQFQQWNPTVGAACGGLWANAYVCISILGHTPTPTNPGNGINTPTPIQSGVTTSCKTFHFVTAGQNCDSISRQYGISLSNFVRWNPAAGSTCTGLWASTWACIAVL